MAAAGLFFYLFATVTVASAFMVIASHNPVHSVLFLILAFFNAAGLFMLMGAEFLALILVNIDTVGTIVLMCGYIVSGGVSHYLIASVREAIPKI